MSHIALRAAVPLLHLSPICADAAFLSLALPRGGPGAQDVLWIDSKCLSCNRRSDHSTFPQTVLTKNCVGNGSVPGNLGLFDMSVSAARFPSFILRPCASRRQHSQLGSPSLVSWWPRPSVRRYSGCPSFPAGRLVFILCLCLHACRPLATKPCIVCGFCRTRPLTRLGGEDGERVQA